MFKRFGLSLIFVPVAVLAHGQHEYRCTSGDQVRRIEVSHVDGAPVPCAVNYHKDTEAPGQSEELWRAQNDAAYCDARAEEFATRLEALGWQCAAVAVREETATQ